MTPNEKTGGVASPGHPFTATYPTARPQNTTQSGRGVRKPTDLDRVLAALRKGWTCAISFNHGTFDGGKPILRYTARFHDLRKAGWYVERRKCEDIWHNHDAPMYEWRIPPTEPSQPDLFGGGL